MSFAYSSPFFLLLHFFVFYTAHAANSTLTQGQSMKPGQSLVSSNGKFELGFFSPGNSTSRYVGIWYANISTQTVIWVANRGTPLTNSTGRLTIGDDGNLILIQRRGAVILWSTNVSTTSNSTTAQLSDAGQLRLKSSNGTVLYDSFEHPTDTFVPGMKISLNKQTGERILLTSWKSPNDPSVGNYTLGLDPSGSAQIFIWKGSVLWWRSGQWDGTDFIGSMMRPLYLSGFQFSNEFGGGSMSFSYVPTNSSDVRFVLEWNGVEETSILKEETREWDSVWLQPGNECEIYGKCGNYGICSNSSDEPVCSCLKGFEPESSEEYSKGNWSGGCVRRTPLQCQMLLNSSSSSSNNSNTNGSTTIKEGKADGFFRLQGVKVPDHSDYASTVGDEADCLSACLNNCSCKAYTYISSIGCLTWGRDLIDIYQFPEGGKNLYIKLAGSELGTKGKIWKTIVIVCSLVLFLLIICIFLCWKCNAKFKHWWKKEKKEGTVSTSVPSGGEVRLDFSGPSMYEEEGQEGKATEIPMFSFDFLATATNNFSNSNKLGSGGFGHVYKGLLPGGEEVAVKRLSRSSGQGQEEFKNEMILIAKLQHRNLVRLLGFCVHGEEKMLIYEYMINKSLDAFLFDPTKQALLDWKKRFNIIEGVARGLVYLHRDSRLRIVHRDLKSSNILLDEEMNPKISDFGMARIFGSDENQENTNRVVGTFGYMSPEYAMEGLFSAKSDVYSFGILVLEIVSGRKNSSFHKEDAINIVGHAWQFWNEDRALELVDPSIRTAYSTRQALRCIRIGLLCVQDRAIDRPDMPQVVIMLGSETTTLPMPKQPTFIIDGSPGMTKNREENFSVNDVTITILKGR